MTLIDRTVARFERLVGARIHEMTEVDLQRLIDGNVEESTDLDFKAMIYDKTNDDKDELCKDVAALANAVGGVLVLGIAEVSGRASKVRGVDVTESEERHIQQVLANRVTPYVDFEVIRTAATEPGKPRCFLILVPRSPYAPHAVRPHGDDHALKYPRRNGRNTEWLSEALVADLYRNRFEQARSQADRLSSIVAEVRQAVTAGEDRGWLVLGLVPDLQGSLDIDRAALKQVQGWFDTRTSIPIWPPMLTSARATAGHRRVVFSHRDGATTTPSELHAEFHTDGSGAVAIELEQPIRNRPCFYEDLLIGDVFHALSMVTTYSTSVSRAGGNAMVEACLYFPAHEERPIEMFGPSWTTPPNPGGQAARPVLEVATRHTIDLDACTTDAELLAGVAVVGGHLLQHFGQPDAVYLDPAGRLRVNAWHAREQRRLEGLAANHGFTTTPEVV